MRYSLNLILLASLGFLAGCTANQKITHVGAPNYRGRSPIVFNVRHVDVVNSYVAPDKAPHVEHLMPYRLSDYIGEWAHHRLQPGGDRGFAILTIETASIIQVPLPKKRGLVATFGHYESDRYDAEVAVRIDFMDYKGYPNGVAYAKVRRSQTVLDNASIAERQAVWQNLSQQAVDAMDDELESSIREHTPRLLID